MHKRAVAIILLSSLLISCSTYNEVGSFRWKVHGSYSQLDTLYFGDYILCNSQDYSENEGFTLSARKRVTPINQDSVVSIFRRSLARLNMNTAFDSVIENHCDMEFHRNHPVRIRRIDEKRIIEIAKLSGQKTVLVPFFRIYQRTSVIIRGSPAMSHSIRKVSFLTLILMIVRDDQIIYRKGYWYSVGETVEEKTDPYPEIEQIHWDNLVRLAMEDYMERMK